MRAVTFKSPCCNKPVKLDVAVITSGNVRFLGTCDCGEQHPYALEAIMASLTDTTLARKAETNVHMVH